MATYDFMANTPTSPRWTASDYSDEALLRMPVMILTEFQQTHSQIIQSVNNWVQRTKSGFKDAYKGLYFGSYTGNYYNLPFFTDYNHQVGQNWQENQGPLGDTIQEGMKAVENIAKVFKPSAGIIYPKSWAGANEVSYETTFDLINTVSPGDVEKNRQFIKTFTGQNLHEQENTLTVLPPVMYEVLIPGVRWSPVAVVSNLSITNKGTLFRDPETGYITPDAWGVSIQFRELINESRNIFNDVWSSGGLQPGGVQNITNTMNVRVFDSR